MEPSAEEALYTHIGMGCRGGHHSGIGCFGFFSEEVLMINKQEFYETKIIDEGWIAIN